MMMVEEVKEMLEKKFSGGTIQVTDLTGTNDHFEARIVWPGFEGKMLIAQHKLVNEALAEPLRDGRIHALTIKTKTN